jgi:hypothetical protein
VVEKVATPGGGKFEQRVRLGKKGVCQSTNDATEEQHNNGRDQKTKYNNTLQINSGLLFVS